MSNNRKFTYIDFRNCGPVSPQLVPTTTTNGADAGAAVAAFFRIREGYLEFLRTGSATNLGFVSSSTGLLVGLDGADAEGIQFGQGTDASYAKNVFTIGTDPAFFAQLTFRMQTRANIDSLMFGFRKIAAFGATYNEPGDLATLYTDYACIGIGDAAGLFRTETELNNGGLVATNLAATAFPAADRYCCLQVNVSAAGVVTYKLKVETTLALAEAGLAADANAVAYTFDSGDSVIPFIGIAATAAGAPDVQLVKYICGVQ